MLNRLIKSEFESTDYNMHIFKVPNQIYGKKCQVYLHVLCITYFHSLNDIKKTGIANVKSTNQRSVYNCMNTTIKMDKSIYFVLYIS